MKVSMISQQQRKTPFSHNKQRGITLVQALLVLALGATLALVGYNVYSDKQAGIALDADILNATDVAVQTQRLFGANNDYGPQTTATLVQSGAIPPRMRVAGTNTAQNSFSLPVTVAPANGTGTNDLMVISWPIPRTQCSSFVAGVNKFSRRITVDGAAVKALDGVLAGAGAAAACDAAATPVVAFSIGTNAQIAQ